MKIEIYYKDYLIKEDEVTDDKSIEDIYQDIDVIVKAGGKLMDKEIEKLFTPYAKELNFDNDDWRVFIARIDVVVEKARSQSQKEAVEEFRQLVIEDVPHKYQERLLKALSERSQQ